MSARYSRKADRSRPEATAAHLTHWLDRPRPPEEVFCRISRTWFWGSSAVPKSWPAGGSEALAPAVNKPSKRLDRMIVPRGNRSTDIFFYIARALQKKTHVSCAARRKRLHAVATYAIVVP
jgi:hypothetical protein